MEDAFPNRQAARGDGGCADRRGDLSHRGLGSGRKDRDGYGHCLSARIMFYMKIPPSPPLIKGGIFDVYTARESGACALLQSFPWQVPRRANSFSIAARTALLDTPHAGAIR